MNDESIDPAALAVETERLMGEILDRAADGEHAICKRCLGLGAAIFQLALTRAYASAMQDSPDYQAILFAAEMRYAAALSGDIPTLARPS